MWDWLINFIAWVLWGIESFVGDWGLAIILLTVIVRLILTPMTVHQMRSTARMQVLQPKIAEIQERYADDPQRMSEEMQAFYSQNKFNPLSGCLPILIQMPIFFSLFSVLRDHLPDGARFYGIFDSLATAPRDAVAQMGWGGAWMFLLALAIYGLLTLIPMLLNQQGAEGAQVTQTRVMGVVMMVLMVVWGWGFPIGVIIYYITTSAWQVVQQLVITQKIVDGAKASEAERLKTQPVKVDVVRKEHKARPHKRG